MQDKGRGREDECENTAQHIAVGEGLHFRVVYFCKYIHNFTYYIVHVVTMYTRALCSIYIVNIQIIQRVWFSHILVEYDIFETS